MADKQALNATFFAFRKREKGGVLTAATIAYAVLMCVLTGLFVWFNWQGVIDYTTWITSLGGKVDPNNPDAFAQMMTPPESVAALGGSYFLFILAVYILFAAYEAACLRWMIRGESGGVFGLSLGADTWRVYFSYWIWFLLLVLFYIVCFITVGGAMISMMVAAGQGGGAPPSGSVALIPLVLGIVILAALIYFSVRLAPAAATSVARRRFAFFDAWKVTRGRFWALFGAFLLLWIMYIVLCLVVGIGIGVFTGTMAMQQMGQTQTQSVDQALSFFSNPTVIIAFALMYGVLIVAAFMLYIAMFGVNARAAQAALEEGKIQAAA